MTLDKTAVYGKITDVLAKEWDPIGVGDDPHTLDEYSGYVAGAYGMAVETGSAEAIARHLMAIESVRMGLRERPLAEVLPVGRKILRVVNEASQS